MASAKTFAEYIEKSKLTPVELVKECIEIVRQDIPNPIIDRDIVIFPNDALYHTDFLQDIYDKTPYILVFSVTTERLDYITPLIKHKWEMVYQYSSHGHGMSSSHAMAASPGYQMTTITLYRAVR